MSGTSGERARIVCTQCHARKVKCDLQDQSQGACGNCVRLKHTCLPRDRQRIAVGQKRTLYEAFSPASLQSSPQNTASFVGNPTETNLPQQQLDSTSSQSKEFQHNATSSYPVGYVGERSLMSWPSPTLSCSAGEFGTFTSQINDMIIKATGAATLPSKIAIEASADIYFKHLFHRIPVLDPSDTEFEAGSVLLFQAVGLIGNILRHPRGSAPLAASEQAYVKVKALLNHGNEKNPVTRLKAVCLISLWHTKPPVDISFDSGWYWIGVAVRQLFQMGLHQESTYANLPDAGVVRRIAWSIYIQDKFVATAYGRPMGINPNDFNLQPIEAADFGVLAKHANVFSAFTTLGTELGKMLELASRNTKPSALQAMSILNSLKTWIHSVPEDMRLYTTSHRRTYRPVVYEVYLCYFACLITFFHVCGHAIRSSTTSLVSLIASSCIARLSEELDHRDDINYMTSINNWYLMVASVPLIHYEGSQMDLDGMCTAELEIIVCALKQMQIKWPQTANVLNTVERLRRLKADGYPSSTSHVFAPTVHSGEKDHLSMAFLQELFPFPTSISPRMGLFQSVVTTQTDSLVLQPTSTNDFDDFEWMFEEWFEMAQAG